MTTEDYRQMVPLKWYKFIIYFQLFASGILNIANAFNYFTGNIYGDKAKAVYTVYDGIYLLDMFYGCLLLITGICSFKVRQDLAKFRVKGPTNYLIILGINFFGGFVYTLLVSMISGVPLASLGFAQSLTSLIVGIICIYLNKLYFDNRKFLFTETKSMINESKEYDTYTDTENATNKQVIDSEQNSNMEKLKLLKAKKAINEHKNLYVIISIILYVLAFFAASIPSAPFILALSTPFIAHGIVNVKLKKETSESKIQVCYYMSFIWKFYAAIFALLFLVTSIFMIVADTSKWFNALIVFIPAWIVLSLPNFLDSKWWKHQYKSELLISKLEQHESEQTISEKTNNKFLDALNAQKEKVKRQNTVANEKLTQNEKPAEKIFCANCSKDLTDDIASAPGLMFCPYCDTSIYLQSNKWTCANCGKTNPITVKFCKDCGTWRAAANEQVKDLEQSSNVEEKIIQTENKTKKCIKCSYELKNDAKFCIICGEKQPK